MDPFAFIIHPIDVRKDVARKYPVLGLLPVPAIEWLLKRRSPLPVAEISGVRSLTGAETHGWLIGCPLSPRQFNALPLDFVYHRLEQCGRIAEELGARIIGLGAFTSVVGDGGITLAKRLNIAVTTGNSYTIATAVDGARKAAEQMGIDIGSAVIAIVGASGSIGATCALLLGRSAGEIVLIGRSVDRLEHVRSMVASSAPARVSVTTQISEGLKRADVVIAVSSATEAIIMPSDLKPGSVVCDVARPRDVSIRVAREREDVLVIEGGVVRVPGEMQCRKYGGDAAFSFGFPPGTAYACMSETMGLALEGRYESYTLGKDVTVRQADEINGICTRHGFALDGFRSFEHAVDEAHIARVRRRAGR